MTTISMFYGVIIRMGYTPNSIPHIHAYYKDYEATFNLESDYIAGEFPEDKKALVEGWIAIHDEELEANWTLAKEGEALYQIAPLQ